MEANSEVEKLRGVHEEKITLVKKEQAEGFQSFKKRCQEEIDSLKAVHLKKIEEFKDGVKKRIGELEERHLKQVGEFSSSVLSAFEVEVKEKNSEEIKKKLKEQKKKDKKLFEEWVATQDSVSEIDEEIYLEEQKNGRKALNKQLKKEYADLSKQLVQEKDKAFHGGLLDEEFLLKRELMSQEESLQSGLQKELQALQKKQQGEEHTILRENMAKIQDLLEQFFNEEVEAEEKLMPELNESLTKKYASAILEIVEDKRKDLELEKEKCRDEYKAKVAKYEENIAKLQNPGVAASAEDKKKAFLTKKFNIEFVAPSEDATNAQIAKLEADFQTFKLEKEQMIVTQREKNEQNTRGRMEERRAELGPLQETHKLRLEKLSTFQKDEKEKLEAKFKELNAAFEEVWKKKKAELDELEQEERKALAEKEKEDNEEEREEAREENEED